MVCICIFAIYNTKNNMSENKSKIYILGYMGSGKSTVGKKLAKELGYRFIDLDKAIEREYKTSISLLFYKYGEETFRKLEKKELEKTKDLNNYVIATGGGTPCFFDNMQFMNTNGTTLYINIPALGLANRLIHAKHRRPLIENLSEEELKIFIDKQLQEREKFYRQAE